jgi:hypothetical protein
MATDTIPLQLPPGVVRSATPSATPGRWFDANLVRWHGGGLQPVGGWERATASPLPSTPRALHTVLDNGGTRRTALLCDAHIFIETGSEYFDATPTTFTPVDPDVTGGGYGSNVYNYEEYGTPRPGQQGQANTSAIPYAFSIASWGEDILFVASSDGHLLRWSPATPTTKAAAISGAPLSNRAMCVTNERHVMCIGAGGNPRRVAWSSREDFSDWNFASTTNTAGFLDVDAESPLIGVAPVRDGVLVFSESDVWLVRYVGLPFVYGIEKLGTSVAPISPMAVAVYEGKAVWLCRHAFWGYESGSLRPIRCDVEDFVFDNINRENGRFYMAAGINGVFPEVWWFYPDNDAEVGKNNRYLIWNYVEGWWSIGAMDRTCMAPAGVYRFPRAAGSDGHIYQHESGWLDGNMSRVGDVYAETSTLSLGAGDRLLTVMQAQPDSLTGADATRFRFYARQTREGSEQAYGPIACRPDGYMDLRLTARDMRLRVEAVKDANWTVGNMRLLAAPRGRR